MLILSLYDKWEFSAQVRFFILNLIAKLLFNSCDFLIYIAFVYSLIARKLL